VLRPRAPAAPLLGGRPGQACTPRGLRGLSTYWKRRESKPPLEASGAPELSWAGPLRYTWLVAALEAEDGQHDGHPRGALLQG